jgi:hypothetical protein
MLEDMSSAAKTTNPELSPASDPASDEKTPNTVPFFGGDNVMRPRVTVRSGVRAGGGAESKRKID